ncbi:MAG: hypothetical protein ACI8PZ_002173 [Myxococcota bacterium]|jgi:hypothetical protein
MRVLEAMGHGRSVRVYSARVSPWHDGWALIADGGAKPLGVWQRMGEAVAAGERLATACGCTLQVEDARGRLLHCADHPPGRQGRVQ